MPQTKISFLCISLKHIEYNEVASEIWEKLNVKMV